jgi:TolB-like protein
MARDPEQRFPDALKMREAVRRALVEWPDSGKAALAAWWKAPASTEGAGEARDVRSDDVPDVSWLPSRFEVQKIIGRGGMGLVLEATDRTLGRTVALKLIPRDTDETARRRFLQEARAAATRGHPGIITVFDVDPDGRHVMEHGGESPRNAWRVTRLPPWKWRNTSLCSKRRSSARASILHRDVKPSNISRREGSSLVTSSPPSTASHRRAAGAAVHGAQLRGNPVDARADIYSAGATLYEAATGERLHGDAERTNSVLDVVAEATGDRALATALDAAVSEEMSARFSTAAAFADALRVRPRRRARWLVAALTAGVVIAGVAWLRARPAEPAPLAVPTVALVPLEIRSQRASDFSASGLATAMSDELRQVHFQVIGHNALLDQVGKAAAPRRQWIDAARALGATLVVEGAVDDIATGVRVTFTVSKPSGEPITRFTRDGEVAGIGRLVRIAAETSPRPRPIRASMPIDSSGWASPPSTTTTWPPRGSTFARRRSRRPSAPTSTTISRCRDGGRRCRTMKRSDRSSAQRAWACATSARVSSKASA